MYCDLYDDFFALTAWRDIKQFALYMELDTPEDNNRAMLKSIRFLIELQTEINKVF